MVSNIISLDLNVLNVISSYIILSVTIFLVISDIPMWLIFSIGSSWLAIISYIQKKFVVSVNLNTRPDIAVGVPIADVVWTKYWESISRSNDDEINNLVLNWNLVYNGTLIDNTNDALYKYRTIHPIQGELLNQLSNSELRSGV